MTCQVSPKLALCSCLHGHGVRCGCCRWGLRLPGVVTGSLQVMSRTGTGMSMFSMGLFMAQQERTVACGAGLAALGMALRFVAGPLATLVGAAAFGLRGDVLRFAIIQVRTYLASHLSLPWLLPCHDETCSDYFRFMTRRTSQKLAFLHDKRCASSKNVCTE